MLRCFIYLYRVYGRILLEQSFYWWAENCTLLVKCRLQVISRDNSQVAAAGKCLNIYKALKQFAQSCVFVHSRKHFLVTRRSVNHTKMTYLLSSIEININFKINITLIVQCASIDRLLNET